MSSFVRSKTRTRTDASCSFFLPLLLDETGLYLYARLGDWFGGLSVSASHLEVKNGLVN